MVELVSEVKNHIPLLKQVPAEGPNGKLNVSLFLWNREQIIE